MPNYRKYGLIAWIMMLAMLLINIFAFFLPLIRVNVEEELFTSKLEYSYSASFADLIFGNVEKEAKFKNATKEEKEFLQAFSTEENILDYLYYQNYRGKTNSTFPPDEWKIPYAFSIVSVMVFCVAMSFALFKPAKERDLKKTQKMMSLPLYRRMPGAQKVLKELSKENTNHPYINQRANRMKKYLACIYWMYPLVFALGYVNSLTLVVLRFTMKPAQDATVSLMKAWIWLVLEIVLLVMFLKFEARINQEIKNLPLNEPLIPIIGTKNIQIQLADSKATTEKINDEKPSDHNEMYKLELLQKYKSLLDSGAITEEEYQKKKEELLTQ